MCDLLICLSVQCHPHRKATRRVFTNYLDAANGLTPGPLPDRIEAFFAQGPVVQSDCFRFRHAVTEKGRNEGSRYRKSYFGVDGIWRIDRDQSEESQLTFKDSAENLPVRRRQACDSHS
jgi:hypothetical protein